MIVSFVKITNLNGEVENFVFGYEQKSKDLENLFNITMQANELLGAGLTFEVAHRQETDLAIIERMEKGIIKHKDYIKHSLPLIQEYINQS